jgi:alpha-1,3-rhamnosyl/mannosyltransferase
MAPPLRIAIDARAAAEERGGRGTMVRELLLALDRLDAGHRYELVARRRWDAPLSEAFRWRLLPRRDPWWNVEAGATAHRHAGVFLSTNSYLTAWFTRVPTVVVVCDLVAFDDALAPQRRARAIERATLPPAVRRAAALTAISQATADDLAARFPAARPKTAVTPLAADERFARDDGPSVAEVRVRHGLGERPYVLAVGTLEPRKNLPRLVEAFAALPPALRDAHELVLAGAVGWNTDATLAAVARHRVRQLGHVPEDHLPALYRGAAAFAYPSLYEGFGLPVVEAMAAGAPVLTSNVSSLPEVAGDAALLVDPWSVPSIRDGLARLLADRDLARRLAARGRERAATFSWERHAREVLTVVERAAAARARRAAA